MDDDARAKIEAFFARRLSSGSVRLVDYEPVSGGYSRETTKVWIESDAGRAGFVIRSDPRTGNSVLRTDRTHEWALLSALAADGTVSIATPRWFDRDGSELGTPSIVSALIDGPPLLSVVRQREPDDQLQLALPIADALAAIHRVPPGSLPAHLPVPTSWQDYLDSCVEAWRAAERDHVEREPLFRMIACWLEAHPPEPVDLALVHGDLQPANVVVDRDGSYKIIDWEVAHIGDPREDLGYMALAAIAQPPDIIRTDPQQFYDRYRAASGLPASALTAAAIAYFVVLSATTVFLQVTSRLRELAEGATTAINIAYITNIKAGLERILFDAMTDPQRVTGMAS